MFVGLLFLVLMHATSSLNMGTLFQSSQKKNVMVNIYSIYQKILILGPMFAGLLFLFLINTSSSLNSGTFFFYVLFTFIILFETFSLQPIGRGDDGILTIKVLNMLINKLSLASPFSPHVSLIHELLCKLAPWNSVTKQPLTTKRINRVRKRKRELK